MDASLESTGARQLAHAHTKIVATIGPASEDRVGELIDAGMSVARINFSHGTADEHRRRVGKLRAAAAERDFALGILADLPGPKLRLGRFAGGVRDLEVGESWNLREGSGESPEDAILFDFPTFCASVRVEDRVFLADGAVELRVEENGADGPAARVVRGGRIGDRKGVHLPDSELELAVPTEADLVHLELVNELEIDMVGVSFVGNADEIRRVREAAPGVLVVAKIERRAAIEELHAILEASDGVMVARGDLGVELELEQLPMIQKSILQDALREGRFSITATEMLESMVTHSRPTRAEVTDVANAVLDGTDAVMLSAETAVGEHPVAAVQAMDRITRAIEESSRYHDLPRVAFRANEPTFSNAMALAAAESADALSLRKIVCFTETGNTVRLISRYRPAAEVIALTPHARTLSHMAILAHVRPVHFPHRASLEDMLESACDLLLERGMVATGEELVFVAGVPARIARSTNMIKLHRVGEPVKLA